MDAADKLIIINGEDKTDSVASIRHLGGKCLISFNNSEKVYRYNSASVRLLALKKEIDPKTVILRARGAVIPDAERILYYGEFYRVLRSGRKPLSLRINEVEICKNCLADENCKALFSYFRDTAEAMGLVTENERNILKMQYDRINAIADDTVLAKYFCPAAPLNAPARPQHIIYPFGMNLSQKKALDNALSSQISIIQGPPGTGKTQTILNIISNTVLNSKTVAVVSNNNSATHNVYEKLEKQGLSFLTAFLGSLANKEAFIDAQTGKYPDMSTWCLSQNGKEKLYAEIDRLSAELELLLAAENRIAGLTQELYELRTELHYFCEYYHEPPEAEELNGLSRLGYAKLTALWLEYENSAEKKPGFFKKLAILLRFSPKALKLLRQSPEQALPFIQKLCYESRLRELDAEKQSLEAKLRSGDFEEKMKQLRDNSMRILKAELAERYTKAKRKIYENSDFRSNSEKFTQDYPVILSTTYSIRGTLSSDFVYDIVIADEASQVDLATGVLAFSCAKNIVIVGDQKQLPNVLTDSDIKKTEALWERQSFDERYRFATHSMLASAAEIWSKAPCVLLREHYRCHPKIAGFFNRQFYGGELVIMTKDGGEQNVLSMYRTVPGNHARGRLNQRQIDIIRDEIIPALTAQGCGDIGIITPYRDQAEAIREQLGEKYEAATVHKFQGREKDAIILSSVDNVIGPFADDANLMNVAVSRAVSSLSVVISDSPENDKTNYGDLARYISYNNMQIVESRVRSVFDMLYKGYYAERMRYLKKHGRVSEFDSENLALSVIRSVLKAPEYQNIGLAVHHSLAALVGDTSAFSQQERLYALNPLTHIDFLLFNSLDKSPVLAIEIDGTAFHSPGSRQAGLDKIKNSVLSKCGIPILRLRTDGSGEKERISAALSAACGSRTYTDPQ